MGLLDGTEDKRRSLDDKDVRLAILAFLVDRKEQKQPKPTANAICKKAPEFQHNVQRNQRVQDQLEALLVLNMVRKEALDTGSIWEITDDGYQWYKQYAMQMRHFFYIPIPSKRA